MGKTTIDLTPTWSELLEPMLAVIQASKNAESVSTVKAELKKMAAAADLWNQHVAALAKKAATEQGYCIRCGNHWQVHHAETGQCPTAPDSGKWLDTVYTR